MECELVYPAELLDLHNDYPLARDSVNIEVEMFSETQVAISRNNNSTRSMQNLKRVRNLMKSSGSCCHYLIHNY